MFHCYIGQAPIYGTPYQKCRNVDIVFLSFTHRLCLAFKQANTEFRDLRRTCCQNINIVGGLIVSSEFKEEIGKANDLDDLFDIVGNNTRYSNWMNVKIFERMASICPDAMALIEEYKKEIFSRPLSQVIENIPKYDVPEEHYTKIRQRYGKDFFSITVKEIVDDWQDIEEKFNVEGCLLIKTIADGCIEICWLLHSDLFKHAIRAICAICATVSNQPYKHGDQSTTDQLFPDVLYLEIGSIVVKNDKGPLSKL